MTVSNASNVLDRLIESGGRAVEGFGKFSEIGINALKSSVDNHLDFGAAVAELAGAQLKNLSELGAPSEILHRQKDVNDAFGAKLQAYYDRFKESAEESHQAYSDLGKEVFGNVGDAFAKKAN